MAGSVARCGDVSVHALSTSKSWVERATARRPCRLHGVRIGESQFHHQIGSVDLLELQLGGEAGSPLNSHSAIAERVFGVRGGDPDLCTGVTRFS